MSPVRIEGMFEPNPRGNLWSKNQEGFGYKMLSKMGWSKGKGLGRNEDGIAEHIKVRKKSNNGGLGWKAALTLDTQEYDALLTSLSKVHSKFSDSKNVDHVRSMEKRSRQFKHRLHYRKFICGKDVSQYSDKDFNCIFASKNKKEETAHAEDAHCGESSFESSVPMFRSQLTTADYFASKIKSSEPSTLNADSMDWAEGVECEAKLSPKQKKTKLSKEHFDAEPITEKPSASGAGDEPHSKPKNKKSSKLKRTKSCLKRTLQSSLKIRKKVSFNAKLFRRDIGADLSILDSEQKVKDGGAGRPYWKFGYLREPETDVPACQADVPLSHANVRTCETDVPVSNSVGEIPPTECPTSGERSVSNEESTFSSSFVEEPSASAEEFIEEEPYAPEEYIEEEPYAPAEESIEEEPSAPAEESIEEACPKEPEWEVPRCNGSNYDSWRESQRIAMKMKAYKLMRKMLCRHPVLRKTNVWDIRGYGNWGL